MTDILKEDAPTNAVGDGSATATGPNDIGINPKNKKLLTFKQMLKRKNARE